MQYQITHVTKYVYSEAAPVCQNEVCLTPRESRSQHCHEHRLLITPEPSDIGRRLDYFGNPLTYFAIQEAHRSLTVSAVSRVEVLPLPASDVPAAAWESVRDGLPQNLSPAGLATYQYAFDSPRIVRSDELAQYAAASFTAGRDILTAARDLTARIHTDFVYDPKATHVFSSLADVWHHRRGVCQDFAQIQIACLRSLGMAARYVSGYLRTLPPPGKPRLVGADASHAWLSLFCGNLGWIDFDPTNNVIPATDHITLAWGRDYNDVCPIRGVFIGGGNNTMSVSVDVQPLNAAVR